MKKTYDGIVIGAGKISHCLFRCWAARSPRPMKSPALLLLECSVIRLLDKLTRIFPSPIASSVRVTF
jgi:hypothetical protein